MLAAWLAACVAALLCAAQRAPEPPAKTLSGFEFPAGRAATSVAAIHDATKPVATPADLGKPDQVPAVPEGSWTSATWEKWGAALGAEAAAPGNAERRARLALLALEQRRFEDAWAHLAATSADARWTAAILPRFLPGVPPRSASGIGGRVSALPDGVALSPSLPPPSRETTTGRVDRRSMSISELAIGDAVISMHVTVEAEGVQIDVKHVSGGIAKLSIRIPRPRELAFGNEYVDWYRQDEMHVAHAILVQPGEEEHTLYGRFEPRPVVFATTLPPRVPEQLGRGRLWLRIGKSDPERPLIDAVASSLSGLKLGFECAVSEPGTAFPSWTGIQVDLANPSEREEKLVWLASSVERFALESRAPARPR